jgi:hypothetical protein
VKRGIACERRRNEEGIAENNPFTGVFKLTDAICKAAKETPFR